VPNEIKIQFMDGIKIEINGPDAGEYEAEFWDADANKLVYKVNIHQNCWAAPSPRYYMNWHTIVRQNGHAVADHYLDLTGKRVLIAFGSKALGDNVAWTAHVEEFRKKHDCEVHLATFWNQLFKDVYPQITFVEPGRDLSGYHALYCVGAYDNDYTRNKNNWHLIPLQQICSDGLGLPYSEVRTRVRRSSLPPEVDGPYVCISEYSTWYAKMWSKEGGWQKLVNLINDAGYKVVSVSKEPCLLDNVITFNGRPIEETVRHLQHAKAFIGPSCGVVVLAWALGVPTVLVSGSTEPWSELQDVQRVETTATCKGCFNDLSCPIDRGNWRFCPRNRNFECSEGITAEMVYSALRRIIDVKAVKKLLYLTAHCSTGGGPQYLQRCVEEMHTANYDMRVVEYANLSDEYVVQKNRIRALVPFYTLNGDKLTNLKELMETFQPDIVHLQEFPERFMSADVADWLYRSDRTYKIIETPHSQGSPEKKWWPDGFAFVSDHHKELFKDKDVPARVVEYTLAKHRRPPRYQALKGLKLDADKVHILHVGLLCPHKNQAEIVEIARRLPEFEFHLVGNAAENFESYWAPVLKSKPKNVKHWGERADIDLFYSSMDLFLFSSTWECNPLVLKEAISWDMPVLMRPLSTVDYSRERLVEYYVDVDEAVDKLQRRFPNMRTQLQGIYTEVALG
jgi:autotransporter strand-loop-strand O-heptosyltransferase